MSGKQRCAVRLAAAVCAAAAVFILFLLRKRLTHIILPLIIGGILFYILDPLICYLEKKPRMRRGAAIIVVYLVVVTIFTALLVFAAPVIKSDIISLAEDVPAISDRLNSAVNIIFDAVFGKSGGENKIGGMLRTHAEDLLERTVNGIGAKIRKLGESAPKIYEKSADFILDSVTGIIFSYYFLKDKNKIGRWLLGFFPYDRRDDILRVFKEVGGISSSYVRGQLLIAFIIGVLETVGVSVIGLPMPWLLGLLGGLSNTVPYIGPVIGAVPAVFAALMVSPVKAIITVLLFVLVQQLDNNFISPKIIEGRLGLHPVASIIVLFIGGEFFGFAGVLFAIPAYAILRSVARMIVEIVSISAKDKYNR